MEHSLTFNTAEEAETAQQLIAKAMGLPKYATTPSGELTRFIIDRYANPEEVDGKWQIPVTDEAQLLIDGGVLSDMELSNELVTIQKLYFSTIEERDSFNAAEAEYAEEDPSLSYLETGEDENGYYLLVDVIKKPSLWQHFKNWF